jgi:putative ABC transport system substrate-binding protein
VLSNGSINDLSWTAFRQGLAERGWSEGQNLGIDWRVYGSDVITRLPELVSELVSMRVDVIAVQGTEAALAAKQASSVIPIIFCGIADPVGSGLVQSLARPESNLTGTSQLSTGLIGKRLSLLRQIVPTAERVAFLYDSRSPTAPALLSELQVTARDIGVQLNVLDAHGPGDVEPEFSSAVAWGVDALMVVGAPSLYPPGAIVRLAAQNRLPAMYDTTGGFVESGGLMAYGPNFPDLVRRAAIDFVDPILRHAKQPAELPIEQPTTFDFKVNQTTARTLGLILPTEVAKQITEWVE